VITVCEPFAQELQLKGVSRSRIYVQHMPIRPSEPVAPSRVVELRTELGINDEAQVLLSVGRLSSEKGHADLIRAFHLLRQKPTGPVHLVLVGDGPERSRLVRLCEQLELKGGVRLVGHQGDVQPYYAMADLFVLPSHSEGSPNVLLEAMSAGVPVIATAVGGVPELLSDERNALLVKRRDVSALTVAICRLLEDVALRERLKSKGLQSVLRHTPVAYYRAITGVFQEALCG
jgi:glycosyltransferase involved in cell wall biosynthesis